MDFVPLCEPWPYTLTCDLSAASVPATGAALSAASEFYWSKSGHRFGSCEVLLRPCKADCPASWGLPYWSTGEWPQIMGPSHAGWALGWLCERCGGGCSCGASDDLILPVHAQSVTEVTVDGVVLPPSAYQLYEASHFTRIGAGGRRLVRVDGANWPSCQDWSIPVSGTGAWTVKAVFGWPVPTLGQLAVGEMMCEIAKAIEPTIGECRLPSNVVRIVRAQVSYDLLSAKDLVDADVVGLPLGDRFLDAENPHARSATGAAMGRLRGSSKIWNPDDF